MGARGERPDGDVEIVVVVCSFLLDASDDRTGRIGVDQHGVDMIVAARGVDLDHRVGDLTECEAALADFVTVGVEHSHQTGEVRLGIERVASQAMHHAAPGLSRLVVRARRAESFGRCPPGEVGRLGRMRAQRRDQRGVVLHHRPRTDLDRDLEAVAGSLGRGDRGVASGVDLAVGRVGEDDDDALVDFHLEPGGEPALGVDDVELGAFGGRDERDVLLSVLQDPPCLQQVQQLWGLVRHGGRIRLVVHRDQ